MFRSRIVAAAEQSTPRIEAIFREIAANAFRRRKPPREETVTDIIRNWRGIPADNQIGGLIVKQGRRGHLMIADTRLIGSNITHLPDYGAVDEIAVCLVTYALTLDPKFLPHPAAIPIATFNHHALGRRPERRPSQADDASILQDIAAMLAVAPRLLTIQGRFKIQTPASRGHWKGWCENLRQPDGTLHAALHCRTWIPDAS